MNEDLHSLFVIAAIAACVPLLVGMLRLKIAEVVLLLAFGVICGPQMLGWIQVTDAITLLSDLGLGLLFFVAGLELEQRAVRGRAGRLAAYGWLVSIALAFAVSISLELVGLVHDSVGVAIALTSTAMGTLLPILRDAGELKTPFGTLFMGAGAWGEFGPIVGISVLLSTKSSLLAIATLVGFVLVGVVLGLLPQYLGRRRLREVIERGGSTSSQTALRITLLLLIGLLALADRVGLDLVLGAFITGLVVHRYSPPGEDSVLQRKVEAIAFGFLIPLFFVISGANLDIWSIIENPSRLLVAFVLLALIRGLPQYFIYRKAIPNRRQRARFALLVATALPIIVAVTSLEVSGGVMQPANAAALVGAGALSVLVFPLLGNAIARGTGPTQVVGVDDGDAGSFAQERAEKTA